MKKRVKHFTLVVLAVTLLSIVTWTAYAESQIAEKYRAFRRNNSG